MDVQLAFERIAPAFPTDADFRGLHFRCAYRCDVWLIEQKNQGRYYYWLLAFGEKKLIHSSVKSKLRPLQKIGDSFKPSLTYDE